MLNREYLLFKQRIEESPLNMQYKEIQKQISDKAQSIESNVYFRKETKRKDQQELDNLNEQRRFIHQRIVYESFPYLSNGKIDMVTLKNDLIQKVKNASS